MAYALNPGLFVENGPAVQAASAASARNPARFLWWRKLDADHRIAAVDQVLKAPANDRIDAYPVAL